MSHDVCTRLKINYPCTGVVVTVDLINFKELSCTVQINQVEDGVACLPLRMTDIPLIELYPTIEQDKNNVVEKLFDTAKAIDSLRFFYNHLWMPWDENYDDSDSWVTSHLEGRLYLQFELMECKVPNEVAYNVLTLISKGRNVLREIEDIQEQLSDEKECLLLLVLTELHNEMTHLQNQFSVFEKPGLLEMVSPPALMRTNSFMYIIVNSQ
ncbi:protein nessun dorma-like [Macrosteles quadrilineatus]|uniref:protein nessun dorma-like n=1 Tax=Macrosteles quadrilineatus TaxID=74068 RepID=UPI0023E233CB|nr:protein nessun dorma-like [Macrosteles quadrilineatus]